MPGQYDRYNMRRQITLTANVISPDLGNVGKHVEAAIKRAGELPDRSASRYTRTDSIAA